MFKQLKIKNYFLKLFKQQRNGYSNVGEVTGLGCILGDIKDKNILKDALELFLNDPRADPNIVYIYFYLGEEFIKGIEETIEKYPNKFDVFFLFF